MGDRLLRYEFPASEKLRTMMRLANLFSQLEWFAQQNELNNHRAAISTYFEIQEVTSRGDQKNDLLQELGRLRTCLEPLSSNPNIDQISLKQTLSDIQASSDHLNTVGIRISHLSTQNEFLKALSHRAGLPAATCEFDVPIYHHWLHLPTEQRKECLRNWFEPLKPYVNAIDLILRVLRSTADTQELEATHGSYQQVLSGKTYTLVQIYVDPGFKVVPKLSANRHLLSISFLPAVLDRCTACSEENKVIPFRLGLCNI